MTTTLPIADVLIEAFRACIEQHASELDRGGTRSVTVTIKMDTVSQRPRVALFTRETEMEFPR